jgi:hypothetical protein
MSTFADLVSAFADRPDVVPPGEGRGFGSSALRVGKSIFAMEHAGRVVVKLPAARVTELIGSGVGGAFDGGKGRPMKEWLTVLDDALTTQLAEEALAFVGGR